MLLALLIFAASSLKEPFEAIARQFEAKTHVRVELAFAGSQELRAQIEQGAPAGVFASANEKQLPDGRVFARNTLAIVTARGNPLRVRGLADLARLPRVVLAAHDVPAGGYAEEALRAQGLLEAVSARVVSRELNVRQVLTKVALGEADAGIVYATDARHAEVDTVAFQGPVARYPIKALPAGGRDAVRFVDYVLSAEGQAPLRAAGFLAP